MKRLIVSLFILLIIMAVGCADSRVKSDMLRETDDPMFTYIDSKGNLNLRGLTPNNPKIVLKGENIEDYQINPQGSKIAYVKQGSHGKKVFIIYDFDSDKKKTIYEHDGACSVEWSPDGKNLILDSGSGVYRKISLYDVDTDKLSEEIKIIGYMWSPKGNYLAIGIPEQIGQNNENKNELLSSISIALVTPGETIENKKILSGTKDYFVAPLEWIDNDTLLIQKVYFDGERPQEPYRINVNKETLKKVDDDLGQIIDSIELPDQIKEVIHHVSLDKRYVIYSHYDSVKDTQKIFLHPV